MRYHKYGYNRLFAGQLYQWGDFRDDNFGADNVNDRMGEFEDK